MNGFTKIVKGFSQVAIDALVTQADEMYISEDALPSAITDFNASDASIGQVLCTWSPSIGATSYSLYTGTTELATDVTSPYYDTYTGTRNYHVKAINSAGSTDSNIDSGTGIESDGIMITGLQSGNDQSTAISNRTIIQDHLKEGGTLHYIIPDSSAALDGTWYVDKEITGEDPYYYVIQVLQDTTLDFQGKLTQLNHWVDVSNEVEGITALLQIAGGNVVLNQPKLDQGGERRTNRPGTHSTLTIYGDYNTGNITINGGLLEGGGSNNFQGGRNNTVFNGTTFRNSREHCIYGYGIGGDGTGNDASDGLVFNDCFMENPGYGNDTHESNHYQTRSYRNVELNRCTFSGIPQNGNGQQGVLLSDVQGFTATDCTWNGFTNAFIWTGSDGVGFIGMGDVTFLRCDMTPNPNWDYPLSNNVSGTANYNECNFYKTRKVSNTAIFTDCLINGDHQSFEFGANSDLTFDTCTWDYSNYGGANAITIGSGATYNFIGTQTKLDDGSINWYPVP